MTYVSPNFKTKKALREAVADGKKVTVFSLGPFPVNMDGKEYIEGPHFPAMHTWYTAVIVKDGYVTEVLK